MPLDLAEFILKVAAAIVALLGLLKGVHEYRLQGALKRADFVLKKNEEFFSNERLQRIRVLVQSHDDKLAGVDRDDRRAYLTFFEEIALLRNSGLIRNDVARYMYGYYAIRCLDSEAFWTGLKKSEKQWGLFLSFAQELKEDRSTPGYKDWIGLKF